MHTIYLRAVSRRLLLREYQRRTLNESSSRNMRQFLVGMFSLCEIAEICREGCLFARLCFRKRSNPRRCKISDFANAVSIRIRNLMVKISLS